MARGCVHPFPKVQLSKCLEFVRSKFMRGLVRTIDSPDITRGLGESRILACRRFGAYRRLARGVQGIFSPELDRNSFNQQIRLEVAPRWTVQQRSDGLFTRGRLGLSSLLSQKFSTLHSLSSTRCATDTPILCRPVNIPPTPAWRSINNVSKLHGTLTSPPPQRGVASTTWASYMER